jgi:flagellar capping protein FliD
VQQAAKKLMLRNNPLFEARTVETSDSSRVIAMASAGAARQTYDVKLKAIATSQRNSGTLLSGASASVVSQGINEFTLTLGGKTTKLSVVIAEHDTNDQALSKLQEAINAAKTGITATMLPDADTGHLKLELCSDHTGTDQAFEVEDVIGNAMSATGVRNATQIASNASYSVNGGAIQTSQSNTIELEKDKVTATLLAPSMETVRIQVNPDADKIISQVSELISSYNAMVGRLTEAGGILNPSIRKSLDFLVDSPTYEQLGLYRDGDGLLQLDEEQFKKNLRLNFDQTTRAISSHVGLAYRLALAMERFNTVPASSLMNQTARQLQQFAIYQSSIQITMPTYGSGLFVNMLF